MCSYLALIWHVVSPLLLRLAAISLLVLQNEEEAFWCLVAVVEAIMPQDYYTKDLVASQVRNHTMITPFICLSTGLFTSLYRLDLGPGLGFGLCPKVTLNTFSRLLPPQNFHHIDL